MHALFGYPLLIACAWALSENRRAIAWRTVAGGFALQLTLALLLLHAAPARAALLLLTRAMDALQRATDAGTGFVFGYLGGGALPFVETHPGASFVLAFKILPLVLVISAVSSLLFYFGILQRVTALSAWLLRRTLGIGGALAVGAATHIYLGMIEAPLLIRPYLARMGRGELFALMSCGMAGVAGTVMVIYATILGPIIPQALAAILVASVISTPAAIAIAALMVPFEAGAFGDSIALDIKRPATALDAITGGTADGIAPLVGITTTLLVTIALVTLVNMALAHLPLGTTVLTLQGIFAVLFRPVMWLIGVPWPETATAATLMGTKTVLNELVAYTNLANLPATALASSSRLIMTYALCGFANFGSLGIMIGGIGAMVPERRAEIAALGMKSMVSGTLATCLSGAVAGIMG